LAGNQATTVLNVTYFPFSNAPAELRERKQWVCWRRELRDGQWTKPPYQPDGRKASSSDSDTWSAFEDCVEAVLHRPDFFNGVGYVFSRDDPYFGVDIDAAFRSDADEGLNCLPAILEGFQNAYIEASPSETGLHIIGRANLPEKIPHKWIYQPTGEPKIEPFKIELYDKLRYFTVGGCGNGVTVIGDCQNGLDELISDLPALFAVLNEESLPPSRPVGVARNGAALWTPRPPHSGPVLRPGEGRHQLLRDRTVYLHTCGVALSEIERDVMALNLERCNPPYSREHIRQLITSLERKSPR
jgi:hypothetical protein